MRLVLILPVLFLSGTPAAGHPGGTNAQGCHTNRKTGDYHCHGARKRTPATPQHPSDGRAYYANCSQARAQELPRFDAAIPATEQLSTATTTASPANSVTGRLS